MKRTQLAAALVACIAAGSASAAAPDYYNMLNGVGKASGGVYDYWDQAYSGAGCTTCDNAPLSGGKGDLTDGIIATDNWFVTEAPPGNGPYVGWYNYDPVITFHWNAATTINSVTFHLDDADNAGGVMAPGSIIVNGNTYIVPEPPGSAPFSFTAGAVGFTGTDLSVTLIRKSGWVFLSEGEFNGQANPVPEPETYALMLGGLALLAWRRKGQRRD